MSLQSRPPDPGASEVETGGGDTSWRNSGHGVDRAVLDTFTTTTYSQVKELDCRNEDLECAICLVDLSDDDVLHLLPVCHHVFHVKCIDVWLESNVTCPVCRSDILSFQPGTADRQPTARPAAAADGSEANGDLELGLRLSPVAIQRGNSMGHEVGDRYTLRLPEDMLVVMKATPTYRRPSGLTAVQESSPAGSGRKE